MKSLLRVHVCAFFVLFFEAVQGNLRKKVAVASSRRLKVVILGGDGFCGWPSALHLSNRGHDVILVDNLSRRKIDVDLGCQSLTPISSIDERLAAWKNVSGRTISFEHIDVQREYDRLATLLSRERPDAVVHFAEQRSAPYSMKNCRSKRYTIDNNISGTHNVLCAIVESGIDIHLVHLGTMGVYGYGTAKGDIPEGYLDVQLQDGSHKNILHPAYPGSVYHTTKCLDALLFQFYNKNDKVRITDLHQGIVWGTNTEETKLDPKLINRFDYDSDYGTVLNRFLVQAALGIPLTVYGTGGQTRAFIHISDTCRCIELALLNPPQKGQPVEILNQVAETHRLEDLAKMIAEKTKARVTYLANPRQEDQQNDLSVSNKKFRLLGLDPIRLEQALLQEVEDIAIKYRHRYEQSKIMPSSFWNRERLSDWRRSS